MAQRGTGEWAGEQATPQAPAGSRNSEQGMRQKCGTNNVPYRTLQAEPHTDAELIDVDQLIDYPWLTVTVLRYTNGARYEIACCEHTEADDYEMFYNNILPMCSILLEVRTTDTLPDVKYERTASFWAME